MSVPRWVMGAVVLVLAVPALSLAANTQFDFADLSATVGSGTLAFAGDTGSVVQFGTASSFGLPALPGGDATVMKFPAFTKTQGLLFDTGCLANGGGLNINQYTMIWDILVPNVENGGYLSFYNASATNGNDGDFFLRGDGGAGNRGIGIGGQYDGTILDGTWYRVALVIDAGGYNRSPQEPTHYKYINGQPTTPVSQQIRSPGLDGRFALWPTGGAERTWLLADESDPAETNAGYISSFYFIDRMLSAQEIAALGGPDANGVIPEPSTLVLLALGAVWLLLLRKRG